MDMNIEIEVDKTVTLLYEKPLALHLYIPPHSCHAPGLLTALIFGMTLRIFQLCSRERDVDQELTSFMQRLLERGQKLEEVTPKLSSAIKNAQRYLTRSDEYNLQVKKEQREAAKTQVYFHLPFHPSNPTSEIKNAWRRLIFQPEGRTSLNHMTVNGGTKLPIKRFIMCYHRAPSLGNNLSYGKIDGRSGPKVSSYLD